MAYRESKHVLLGFAALMFVAMTLMLVLPAQAHAEPSTSAIYTVDNVDYHPSKDSDGAWYAVVTGCKNTAGITVKETVKLGGTTVPVAAIYPGAFNGKNKVKTLTIKAPIEWIPISMCNGCTSLQKVTLQYPDKVTEVNAHAFQGCQSLKSISDLKNVWRIDEEAFFDCRSLEALTTQGLRRLGKSAFRDCMSLKRVATIGDENSNEKLKKIPEYAFYGCQQLKDVGNVANVTEVGTYAFNGCHALESMGFSALETVGNLAFQGCDSLSTLYLGNVKTIGAQAFENCAALRIVYSNKRLETIGPRAFRNSGLVIAYMAKTVTSVGERAFEGCTNLEEIIIPDSLHSIPAQMCKGCTKLGTVHISSYVDDSIGSEAFANCTSLKTAYVTNQSVKFLGSSGKGPFSGCSDLVLYGYAPCTAKTYASGEPGVTFVDLSGADVEKASVYFKASRWPDKEDATGSMPTMKTAKYGVFTLPSNEGFEWPGHIFAGWRVSHNGTESDYQPGHQIKNVRGDITCYALWREGSTVTLKRSASPSAETQMSTHALGSMYYVPICPFAVPSGQVFKYWIANDDGDGYLDEGKNANSEYEYAYNPGFSFQFGKDAPESLVLTAYWVTPAKVTLDASGGTFEDGTNFVSTQTNGEGKLDSIPEVSKDGFALDYWQANLGSGSTPRIYPGNLPNTVLNSINYVNQYSKTVELKAIWKPNTKRTIVLDPNGGTLSGGETPVLLSTNDEGLIYDDEILKYKPVRAHYTFVKWRDPAGRLFAQHAYNTFNTDVTLTAEWEPIKVSKIDLNHTTLKLVKGVSRLLIATITPEDALNTEVTWSSSDPKVATVNEGGRVTAVEVGTAVITCASNDHGATATCTVTVETGFAPDGTAVGAGADKIAAQQYLTSYAKESDPKGSKYLPLQLMVSKVSKSSIKLTWKKAAGASYYHVYGAKCGTKKLVRVAMVPKSKSTYTWKKLSNKKLSKNTYYKAVVVAIAEHGKVISTSKMVHAATSGGKKGNCTKITTKAKNNKVTLKVGKTFKLGAKIVKPAGKKVAKHRKAKIAYVSSNKKIATVSSTGKIKAKKKGTCNIYAYAQNGKFVRIKVTVKKAVALTTAS